MVFTEAGISAQRRLWIIAPLSMAGEEAHKRERSAFFNFNGRGRRSPLAKDNDVAHHRRTQLRTFKSTNVLSSHEALML